MTEQEALQILGLQPGASADAIDHAYHNLIAKLHPDESGARYLTQARDKLRQQASTQNKGAGLSPHYDTGARIADRPAGMVLRPVALRPPALRAVRFLGSEKAYWRLL